MSELEEFKALLVKSIGKYFQGWSELTETDWELDGYLTIADWEGDEGRWSRTEFVVTKSPTGKLYKWQWERGLTENQDDAFSEFSPIVEVKPITKTIVVTEYEPINKPPLVVGIVYE